MSEPAHHDSLKTRWSLLDRLKDWGDRESWAEFFDTYRGLIFNVAKKAGLTETEAEEVVQETVITVAKKMPEFRADPKAGSFKAWLLHTTRWKIGDQLRKRKPHLQRHQTPRDEDSNRRTATIERLPDKAMLAPDALWDAEWKTAIHNLALKRVQAATRAKHFQVFYLNVIDEIPAPEVARRTGVSVMQVYRIKYRLSGKLKKEISRLEKELS